MVTFKLILRSEHEAQVLFIIILYCKKSPFHH